MGDLVVDPPVTIATHALCAAFPGGRDVFQDLTMSLPSGACGVLLGANGCGKTTLLRCLSGAMVPRSGTVLLGGKALDHDRASLRAHRSKVQLVLQDPDDQLFSADVYQDVSFGPLNQGLAEDEVRRRVADAVAAMAIEALVDRPTHHLSFGERKRVAIAGALAMQPEVLLLDEPTAGLDPRF